MKPGDTVRVLRANLPTLLAAEISDFHAFNPCKVLVWQKRLGRVQVAWHDGVKAWFDMEAVTPERP